MANGQLRAIINCWAANAANCPLCPLDGTNSFQFALTKCGQQSQSQFKRHFSLPPLLSYRRPGPGVVGGDGSTGLTVLLPRRMAAIAYCFFPVAAVAVATALKGTVPLVVVVAF